MAPSARAEGSRQKNSSTTTYIEPQWTDLIGEKNSSCIPSPTWSKSLACGKLCSPKNKICEYSNALHSHAHCVQMSQYTTKKRQQPPRESVGKSRTQHYTVDPVVCSIETWYWNSERIYLETLHCWQTVLYMLFHWFLTWRSVTMTHPNLRKLILH